MSLAVFFHWCRLIIRPCLNEKKLFRGHVEQLTHKCYRYYLIIYCTEIQHCLKVKLASPNCKLLYYRANQGLLYICIFILHSHFIFWPLRVFLKRSTPEKLLNCFYTRQVPGERGTGHAHAPGVQGGTSGAAHCHLHRQRGELLLEEAGHHQCSGTYKMPGGHDIFSYKLSSTYKHYTNNIPAKNNTFP